jgi:hypothetical protein
MRVLPPTRPCRARSERLPAQDPWAAEAQVVSAVSMAKNRAVCSTRTRSSGASRFKVRQSAEACQLVRAQANREQLTRSLLRATAAASTLRSSRRRRNRGGETKKGQERFVYGALGRSWSSSLMHHPRSLGAGGEGKKSYIREWTVAFMVFSGIHEIMIHERMMCRARRRVRLLDGEGKMWGRARIIV